VPDQATHLAQAQVNRDLASSLFRLGLQNGNQAYLDWAVTIVFYSALHLIEAKLAVHNLHPQNHGERSRMLDATNADADMVLAYDILRDLSEQARYNARNFQAVEVDNIVFGIYLPRVEGPALQP
jgi:hypothetical protein